MIFLWIDRAYILYRRAAAQGSDRQQPSRREDQRLAGPAIHY